MLDDLLGTRQIAALLGKHPLTIDNWRDRGCPYVRVLGGERASVRFRLADVVRWAQANGKDLPAKYIRHRPPGAGRVRLISPA